MQLPLSSSGTGEDILFIHGFLEDQSMWQEILPLEGWCSHCIDLPGHGLSSPYESKEPQLEDFASAVRETLAEQNIQPKAIIGHSLGGYVALYLNKVYPDAKLFLINSNFWTDSKQKKKERDRVVEIIKIAKDHFLREAIPGLFYRPENYPEQIDKIISNARLLHPQSIMNTTLAMRNRIDFSDEVQELKNRLVIFQGSEDRSTPAELMMQKASELVVKVVPDVGHMSPFECPQLLKKFLQDHLSLIKHR